jgi:hypothetical protein
MGIPTPKVDSFSYLSERRYLAPDTTTVASCMLGRGKISLPLQRDHKHPPFMRVSTLKSKCKAKLAVKDRNNAGYLKLIAKRPKPSTT